MPHILTDHIKKHGLNDLRDRYAINIKRHGTYNNLVLLKYSQLESPLGVPVVQKKDLNLGSEYCRNINN